MTMQHLPRPWMLAALTDVPVTLLARPNGKEADTDRKENAPPRPEARRRRLSARDAARQWYHAWYGEDAWGGAERWREVELDIIRDVQQTRNTYTFTDNETSIRKTYPSAQL